MFRFYTKTICSQIHRQFSSNLNTNKKTSLIDLFERHHTYLRISLTERCNLRCQYCMPAEGVSLTPNAKILTSDEIIYLVKIFVQEGVKKIRLTGGEPTVRKELPQIIEKLKNIRGLDSVGLTTNGLVLTRQLVSLQKAGLDALNISLDTLKPERYERITRRKGWERVMMGVDLALQLGYNPVKINCVLIKGFNDDELIDFVELTRTKNVDVRFIEYMPFSGNKWEFDKMVPYSDMVAKIKNKFPSFHSLQNGPNDTSKAWKVPEFQGQIGFITSMSQHFCGSCNRLRLTADGNLKVCLFGNTEVSLRDAIRSGCKEDDLVALISAAVKRKRKQHAESSKVWRFSNNNLLTRTIPLLSCPTKQIPIRTFSSQVDKLSHVNSEGKATMVDVTTKDDTVRLAIAKGLVTLSATVVNLIRLNLNKKGDVLAVAQLAGIIGAKRTSELIPLCHNIPLTKVDVDVKLNEHIRAIEIQATVTTVAKTGVEMEALTAVSLAALTIYDMCKSMGHNIVISDISLVKKTGGASDYIQEVQTPITLPDFKEPIEYTPVGPI